MNTVIEFVRNHVAVSLVVAILAAMSIFGSAAADSARAHAESLSDRAAQIDAAIEVAQGN